MNHLFHHADVFHVSNSNCSVRQPARALSWAREAGADLWRRGGSRQDSLPVGFGFGRGIRTWGHRRRLFREFPGTSLVRVGVDKRSRCRKKWTMAEELRERAVASCRVLTGHSGPGWVRSRSTFVVRGPDRATAGGRPVFWALPPGQSTSANPFLEGVLRLQHESFLVARDPHVTALPESPYNVAKG